MQSLSSNKDLIDLYTYLILIERHHRLDESISHEQMLKELGL